VPDSQLSSTVELWHSMVLHAEQSSEISCPSETSNQIHSGHQDVKTLFYHSTHARFSKNYIIVNLKIKHQNVQFLGHYSSVSLEALKEYLSVMALGLSQSQNYLNGKTLPKCKSAILSASN